MLKRHYGAARLLSAGLSLLALVVIVWVWAASQRVQPPHGDELNSMADVSARVTTQCWQEGVGAQAPVCLPTGVFIQSIHFQTATDVNFTGYIWQKYPRTWPDTLDLEAIDKIRSGVVFPEEVSASDAASAAAYSRIYDEGEAYPYGGSDGYELRGWFFDVTVRQNFDYSKYPLDTQPVWLRMWSGAVGEEHAIRLIPDFDSYAMQPTADGGQTLPRLFGIDQMIVGGGWNINDVYFNYRRFTYDTNFGFSDAANGGRAELFFNVEMRRKFRNAFIINLVPLLIVALLLYSQVLMITRDEQRAAAFGSNASGVIATSSSLFFVVLLSHIQVRQEFAGSELVYIEQFYLIMYCVILLTTLDAFLFAWRRHMATGDQDDRWAKVVFWPATLWAMALASFFQFRDIL